MKTPEEIEQLSIEELEAQAAAQGEKAPQGLQQRLREALAASEAAEAARPRPVRWIPYASLAVAAVAAALVLLPQRGPKDTFDDPYLAYAEVERAFRTISDKMNTGVGIAREAGAAAELPQTILTKIQSEKQ
ncbi:MAG: hypothetical protein IJV37_06370 [Bacteroidales bacterium]|nr:hypothetical protein [Bacteroidales bacterium]